MIPIGYKIKQYRESCGMTQQRLSELSNISISSLKKYEAGERNPKPQQVIKIADALQVYPSAFYAIEANTVTEIMPFIITALRVGKAVFHGEKDKKGQYIPDTLSFSFAVPEINEFLKTFADGEETVQKLRQQAAETQDSVTKDFLNSRATEIKKQIEWEMFKIDDKE